MNRALYKQYTCILCIKWCKMYSTQSNLPTCLWDLTTFMPLLEMLKGCHRDLCCTTVCSVVFRKMFTLQSLWSTSVCQCCQFSSRLVYLQTARNRTKSTESIFWSSWQRCLHTVVTSIKRKSVQLMSTIVSLWVCVYYFKHRCIFE